MLFDECFQTAATYHALRFRPLCHPLGTLTTATSRSCAAHDIATGIDLKRSIHRRHVVEQHVGINLIFLDNGRARPCSSCVAPWQPGRRRKR